MCAQWPCAEGDRFDRRSARSKSGAPACATAARDDESHRICFTSAACCRPTCAAPGTSRSCEPRLDLRYRPGSSRKTLTVCWSGHAGPGTGETTVRRLAERVAGRAPALARASTQRQRQRVRLADEVYDAPGSSAPGGACCVLIGADAGDSEESLGDRRRLPGASGAGTSCWSACATRTVWLIDPSGPTGRASASGRRRARSRRDRLEAFVGCRRPPNVLHHLQSRCRRKSSRPSRDRRGREPSRRRGGARALPRRADQARSR